MTDHYLKFESESEAVKALDAAGLTVKGIIPEGCVFIPERVDIHTVGIIYDMVGEGEAATAVPQEGWHINIRGRLPRSLGQYRTHPNTPRSVWL